MNELNPLIDRLNGIIQSQSPSARAQLARQIATNIRRTQAKRITENKNPDGSQFESRKQQKLRSKKGRLRQRMFTRMSRVKWLKAKTNATSTSIEFVGKAGQIARVNQYGLRDKVNKRGLEVQYPQRELLGLTDAEIEMIEDIVLTAISV